MALQVTSTLVFLFVFSNNAFAEGSPELHPAVSLLPFHAMAGKTTAQLVPKGWKLLESTAPEKGDLNQDKILDLAIAIEKLPAPVKTKKSKKTEDETEEEQSLPRVVLVAFGAADGTYKFAGASQRVIEQAEDGGHCGDPFGNLQIKNETLSITHNFGCGLNSNHGTDKVVFRYQDGSFYLIGSTHTLFEPESEDDDAPKKLDQSIDTNYSTGNYEVRNRRKKVSKKLSSSKKIKFEDYTSNLETHVKFDFSEQN